MAESLDADTLLEALRALQPPTLPDWVRWLREVDEVEVRASDFCEPDDVMVMDLRKVGSLLHESKVLVVCHTDNEGMVRREVERLAAPWELGA